MKSKIPIYVFSYNRPAHLLNAVLSTLEHTSSMVYVVDNYSSDPETIQILEVCKRLDRVTIILHDSKRVGGKVTGLWDLMTCALRHCNDMNYKYAIFMQDDMQYVRDVLIEDDNKIREIFESNKDMAIIQNTYMKSVSENNLSLSCYQKRSSYVFIREDCHPSLIKNYTDTGIFNIQRILEVLDQFQVSEAANNILFGKKNLKLGFYYSPFVMFLPSPVTYRGKKRDILHKFIEFFGGAGFYPYKPISNQQLDFDVLTHPPLDADYLSLKNYDTFKGTEFIYTGGCILLKRRGVVAFFLCRLSMYIKRILK